MASTPNRPKLSKEGMKLLSQLDAAKDRGDWAKVAQIATKLGEIEANNPELYRITLNEYIRRLSLRPSDARSEKWFKRRYAQLKRRKFTPDQMEVGALYFYAYKPETPGTWDFAPLMINLGAYKTKSGHMVTVGLNLHYIPPHIRSRILLSLTDYMETGSRGRLTANSRMAKLTWNIIKKELGLGIAKKLIHSYRFDRFKSAPERIHSADYASVIRMPLQRFRAVK